MSTTGAIFNCCQFYSGQKFGQKYLQEISVEKEIWECKWCLIENVKNGKASMQ